MNRTFIIISYILLNGFASILCNANSTKVNSQTIKSPVIKVQPFFSGEVKLLAGPFRISQDAEAKYLLSLNVDRLLAPFLIESGLVPKDSAYAGWEKDVLPGVALSFFLSGISRLYMITGEIQYRNRIDYILNELETCQQKTGGYLLGTKNGKKIMDRVEREGCFPGFGHWGGGEATPYYSLEKLMSGLRDVYRICHIPKALTISIGIGEWLSKHMSKIPDKELQKLMFIEYGGMNWVLADLYADTNDPRYLSMSKRWQDSITVVPMVNGIDLLSGKHANMQFPKYAGLAARYPYSRETGDFWGARFFWENVVNHRTYVTGGNSESEFFGAKDSLARKLTPYTEENCNEYNMLRLTSLLFQIEPKVEYADYTERTLFNHMLAAQNPEDGKICYFLPLMPGAQRIYQPLYDIFSCCVCSSMDSYTRYAEYIYAHSDSSLFVNLFIDSEVSWKNNGVTLKQETRFPYEDSTILKIICDKPTMFSLQIRNPYWLAKSMGIKVNGKILHFETSSGYFEIKRTWKSGDIVLLNLPMNVRIETMPDEHDKVAFFYGPILLAGLFPDDYADKMAEVGEAPAFLPNTDEIANWLIPSGMPLHYSLKLDDLKMIKLQPFLTLKHGAYSVYWQKMTENQYNQKLINQEKSMQNIVNIDANTIDKVVVTDSLSEKAHGLAGKSHKGSGNMGILMGKAWRMADDSVGFSYTMKVPDKGPLLLHCKFMGREAYEIWDFRIAAGGSTVFSTKKDKDNARPTYPFVLDIPLDRSLIENKSKIKIVFAKNKNAWSLIPKLMELSIVKL